ncbi:ankyrin repeat domain-containing protein [Lysobacter sp. TAB13]|uniref:ankyrin repeat domain-containing protein n=1 Tax=Lysobacter sp. TAB13 TaxID=3233065 RepID=UPI003F9E21EB
MHDKFHREMQAAFVIDDFAAMRALIADGADVNSLDARDDSPILQRAVIGNDLGMVGFLIDRRVDLDRPDRRNMTALHYAALHKHLDAAKALIDAGALIDARDRNGSTPLAFAISDRKPGYQEMAELLAANGADCDIRSRDGTRVLELYGISLQRSAPPTPSA